MQVDPHQFSSQFKANLRLAFHVLGCKHTAEEELMSLAVGGQVSTAQSARPTSAAAPGSSALLSHTTGRSSLRVGSPGPGPFSVQNW